MSGKNNIILAGKCAPSAKTFDAINRANIKAVELYLSSSELTEIDDLVELCMQFPFRYALHAPDYIHNPRKLAMLAKLIDAEVVVFHDIYWDDEWDEIAKIFKSKRIKAKPCIENTCSVHEPLKLMRKYGFEHCLDLEHLEMECAGIYEEAFMNVMKTASHIYMTGYTFGSRLWHTHIHQSPVHSIRLLNMLLRAGFSGFVVSEAKVSLQSYKYFKNLSDFFYNWEVNEY